MAQLYISVGEYKSRIVRLINELQKQKFDGMFVMDPLNVFWLTGFAYSPVERPFGLLIPVEGEPAVVLFKIEEGHWEERIPWIKDVTSYVDYPGPAIGEKSHCYDIVTDMIKEHRITKGKRLAVDGLGMAYHAPKEMEFFKTPYGHGPSMRPHFDKALKGVEIVNKSEILFEWMMVLSETEQQLVREGAKWGFLAHRIAYEIIAPGRTPFEVCNEANMEASLAMIKTLGPKYEPIGAGGARATWPTRISFTAGTGTAYPHGGRLGVMFRKIKLGDNCESGGYGNVGGSLGEIERTFFVGKPSAKQIKYWKIMRKAQNAAYDVLKPGAICADSCNAAYKVFHDEGVFDAVGHHAGHNKPRRGHDPPYLDPGDKTIMKPGMVFTVEPGIYFKDIGGFRFSDTCIITEDGAEWVTDQLLSLEENIVCT